MIEFTVITAVIFSDQTKKVVNVMQTQDFVKFHASNLGIVVCQVLISRVKLLITHVNVKKNTKRFNNNPYLT